VPDPAACRQRHCAPVNLLWFQFFRHTCLDFRQQVLSLDPHGIARTGAMCGILLQNKASARARDMYLSA